MNIKFYTQKLKKALTFATPTTRNLVKAGLDGNTNKFPELLIKYKWSGTRDYNLALIIIALYVYCLKSNNKELEKIGMKARKTNKNSPFEALEEGNGTIVAQNLSNHFKPEIQKLVLNLKNTDPSIPKKYDEERETYKDIAAYNDITCEKVFEDGLFERAKKIKPWKINEAEVVYYIHLLTDPVQKQHEADLKEKRNDLKKEKDALDKELNAAYVDNIDDFIESEKSKDIIKGLQADLKAKDDEMKSNTSKLEKEIEELKSLSEAKDANTTKLKARLNTATREFKKLNSKKFKSNIDKNRAKKLNQIHEELQNISAIESLKKIYNSYDLSELSLTTLQKIIDQYTQKSISILYDKPIPVPKETPENNIEQYLKELETFANSIKNHSKNNKPILNYLQNFKEITNKISDAISKIKFYITEEKTARFNNYNYRNILCAKEDKKFLKNVPKNTIESPMFSNYYYKTDNKDGALDYLKQHGGVLINI